MPKYRGNSNGVVARKSRKAMSESQLFDSYRLDNMTISLNEYHQQHVGLHPTDGTEAVRRTHQHRKRRSRTAPERSVIETALVKNYKETTTGIAAVDQGVKILSFTHTEPVEVPSAKEVVGFDGSPAVTPTSTLELNGVNTPFIRQEELFKSLTTSLPNITLDNDLLGITPVDFLSTRDIEKVRQISLIELTAMFDRVGICHRPIRKSSKKKIKDTGVFGVPLSILVERDRELKPECEVPIFLQRLIAYIEENGLKEEGVLRVPGSTSRIKELQQEVEKCFYEGAFKFQNLRVNDAVGLLKLFLRELPSPPLTLEYVNAFSSVEQITDRKKQLQCLNLLILVLPDVYRATLKMLLSFLSKIVQNENYNRMSLNNVAMIMAPNLFSVKNISTKRVVDFAELAFAAGTSNITRMLVKYHNILWVVPSRMLEQVRKMVDFDVKKNRESKSVMTIFNKKGKEKRRSMLEDVLEGIIRIQTPGDEEKVFTTVQLSEHTTADDIVAKFTQDMHPIATPILRRPQSRGVRRSRRSKTLDKNSAFDSLAGVPPNKTVRFYLYETGGNIGSRCLDPETNMLALVRVNPGAEWIIRPRVV
ncbi:Rho GTPase-activating protein 18 [Holothuria leucospilota]|uniref:Rho GTPase-activating protein 18 n=1 Tax=Holothuria leucospilota TaxID=206669 RepID=A0A9Q0YFN3_HOLLE|nr:Rho GTPase-activating protein 18 [Holothuria leucospilota]